MRRLVLLTAVAVLAIAGVAYAVNNTVTYSTTLSHKGKPSSKNPANLSYTGILHVDTNPPGYQPDTAPSTTVFYSKAIKNNAKYFPGCSVSEINGQPSIPSKCRKAIVGSGTADAVVGSPGAPIIGRTGDTGSVPQHLTVTVINGNGGKLIMLVLNNKPGSVGVQNAVIPGAVNKASGQYGFLTRFQVPAALQEQLGLKIALTDFNVKIPGTTHTVKVNGKSKKLSYLQVTSCKNSLPAKTVVQFDNGTPVTSPQTSAKC